MFSQVAGNIITVCVCIVCVLGITVLYVLSLLLSWREPVTFLFVLKMKTNIHQKTIPSSLIKTGWVTLVLSSFNQLNSISIRLKVYALSVFSFFSKNNTTLASQIWNISLLLNSVLLYLLCNSFSNDPWWQRSALQHSAHRLAVRWR